MDQATTYLVELSVEVLAPVSLEPLGDCVMDAIDKETSDDVLGAAVSVSFEPPRLDLDLSINASSPAELNRIMAEVFQILDARADLQRVTGASYRQNWRPEPLAS